MSDELAFERFTRENVRCCACDGSLREGSLNLVTLQLRATWEYPTAGNCLTNYGPAAVAIVCGQCIETQRKIVHAIEIDGQAVSYHDLGTLAELPPEPTYQIIREWLGKSPAIRCLRCGFVSSNPNDVDQRYCGKCHAFHEG